MKEHYFDYNATTPVKQAVLKAMEPFWQEHYGNPSSLHQMGRKPAKAVRTARREVAALIGAEVEEILFTSGGTESNNTALRLALDQNAGRREIITSAVEHSSIRSLCHQLALEGYKIHEIGVNEQGALDWEEFQSRVCEKTALVSFMWANNETGVIFPIEEIVRFLKAQNVLFHVDAIQAIGKIPVDVASSPIDYLSLSGHKYYAPKGIGALYVRKGAPFHPFIIGGSQERGQRAGTENLTGIVGLGAASRIAAETRKEESARLEKMRDDFERQVCGQLSDVKVNAKDAKRLPNTSNLQFEGLDSEALLVALDQRGIYVSRGSACLSGAEEPSYVLKAMGYSEGEARASLRFSFGEGNDSGSLEELISALKAVVPNLRATGLKNKAIQV